MLLGKAILCTQFIKLGRIHFLQTQKLTAFIIRYMILQNHMRFLTRHACLCHHSYVTVQEVFMTLRTRKIIQKYISVSKQNCIELAHFQHSNFTQGISFYTARRRPQCMRNGNNEGDQIIYVILWSMKIHFSKQIELYGAHTFLVLKFNAMQHVKYILQMLFENVGWKLLTI